MPRGLRGKRPGEELASCLKSKTRKSLGGYRNGPDLASLWEHLRAGLAFARQSSRQGAGLCRVSPSQKTPPRLRTAPFMLLTRYARRRPVGVDDQDRAEKTIKGAVGNGLTYRGRDKQPKGG